MSSTKPDYPGQMVKVSWPCRDKTFEEISGTPGGVYRSDAAYTQFDEKGQLVFMRKATDAEIQWWLSLQAMNRMIDLLEAKYG